MQARAGSTSSGRREVSYSGRGKSSDRVNSTNKESKKKESIERMEKYGEFLTKFLKARKEPFRFGSKTVATSTSNKKQQNKQSLDKRRGRSSSNKSRARSSKSIDRNSE